jgi:lysozyme family protein
MTLDAIIDGILQREGSTFTNDPADHGGPTKYGITLGDWANYLGGPATATDIEALTETTARAFYLRRYIWKPGFNLIADPWVQTFMVDTAVLEGVGTAVKMLQQILGVKGDGVFGPVTQTALQNYGDTAKLKKWLITQRMHHLISCAMADFTPDQINGCDLKWMHGWWNRVASFM